jgi:hypothetical protein
VERIDVPGVERGRMVVVDLEQVPWRGERLAPGPDLDERAHQPVAPELGSQDSVLEHHPLGRLGG